MTAGVFALADQESADNATNHSMNHMGSRRATHVEKSIVYITAKIERNSADIHAGTEKNTLSTLRLPITTVARVKKRMAAPSLLEN